MIVDPSVVVRIFSILREVFLQPLVSPVVLCHRSAILRSDAHARARHHEWIGGPRKEGRSGWQADGAPRGNEFRGQDEQCEFDVIIQN